MKACQLIRRSVLLALTALLTGCTITGTAPEPTEGGDTAQTSPVALENGTLGAADSLQNPSGVSGIGDPFVLFDGGTYYLYCTSLGDGFKVWTSHDLSSWEEAGVAYRRGADSWGTQNFWAPEVYAYGGKYYMVYSAADADLRYSIGLAVSDSPLGPFTDVSDGPFYSPGYSVIDANLLFCANGEVYLYYSRDCSENIVDGRHESHIYGIQLESDLTGTIGEAVLLLQPVQDWELASGYMWRWNEAPCAFEHDGIYYLLYSANYYASFSYAVGYAVSDSPLGPFTKYDGNPILQADAITTSGSGHNCLTMSPDGSEMFIVYHTHTDVHKPSGDRQVCADRLIIGEDGTLSANGPSLTRQPLPSGTDGLVDITAQYAIGGSLSIDAACLTDGLTAAGSDTVLIQADGTIELKTDSPAALSQIWVYRGDDSDYTPGSVSVVINDAYVISDISFDEGENSPAVAVLSGLPEGEQVSSVKLYFSAGTNGSEITEIRLISQQ